MILLLQSELPLIGQQTAIDNPYFLCALSFSHADPIHGPGKRALDNALRCNISVMYILR